MQSLSPFAGLRRAFRFLFCGFPLIGAFAADPAENPSAAMPNSKNPLLEPSSLQFQFPRFDLVRSEDFTPALEQAMAEQLAETAAIANAAAAPTFENTIVALEKTGQTFIRVNRLFTNLTGAHTNPTLQAVEKAMAPRFAAQRDAIRLNAALFHRIDSLYTQRERLQLDAESLYLLERYYKDFVRSGAKLADADKTKLKQINTELASLETTFAQNVLNETNKSFVVVDDIKDLEGMSSAQVSACAAAAKAEHLEGKYVIRLLNTTGQPAATSLVNPELRQRILNASLQRSSHGGEFDNRDVVLRIARLRAQKAELLGYANFAAYALEDQTAGDVATVNHLLEQLAAPAAANARREQADMQALVERSGQSVQITAADWGFYSEKVRRERYAFDDAELRPYFELNRVVLDGVFYAAHRLYGLSFKERTDLPVYEPTVRVFEVFDEKGTSLALFIGDYYARASKRGGAWMNVYVGQSRLLGTKTVVANHLNISAPSPGQPTLLTSDEVRTLFHEFGHALHAIFSSVKYPRFSGTSVPRDFVEYPSQVNEMWATWPEVLKNYAKHYQTGEELPPALLEKMLRAHQFNQGFITTEYLAASCLDQAWHQLASKDVPSDVGAFQQAALRRVGLDLPAVPPRYSTTYFTHVFANGYSAGYYSYIWSEVLDADTVDWFKAHGGLVRSNGDRFRTMVLSRGGSADALSLFRAFSGGDPDIRPLLERRGLSNPAVTPSPAARQ